MVSQPRQQGLSLRETEASSRVAQLEAEIAQLKDALARRQQIGGDRAAGPALRHHPERAWSRLVGVSQNGQVKVRNIAQANHQRALRSTQPSRGRNTQGDRDAAPDGVRPIGARVDGPQPTSESSQ